MINTSETDNRLSVLVLEPYYGGSHRNFLRGLMSHLPFDFTLMDMPARKWKWRMRLAAPHYARKLVREGRRYDRVLCSTFVDVATLRGLGPAWLNKTPVLTYFHENQFAYPVQDHDKRDMHFVLTNMTTAMASDSLAFNSRYNLESFLSGMADFLRRGSDVKLPVPESKIRGKSVVLSPGIDFSAMDTAPEPAPSARPVVLWNHRWEHDKGPEEFFETLFELDSEGVDFDLIVLGESFERNPAIFDEARQRLDHRIIHFGYVDSRKEYARLLKMGTVAVSTARHEFFGISVMEALRAGCRPLLPRRLSYPELFPENYLYDDGQLKRGLKDALARGRVRSRDEVYRLTGAHSWEALCGSFAHWLEGADRQAG